MKNLSFPVLATNFFIKSLVLNGKKNKSQSYYLLEKNDRWHRVIDTFCPLKFRRRLVQQAFDKCGLEPVRMLDLEMARRRNWAGRGRHNAEAESVQQPPQRIEMLCGDGEREIGQLLANPRHVARRRSGTAPDSVGRGR